MIKQKEDILTKRILVRKEQKEQERELITEDGERGGRVEAMRREWKERVMTKRKYTKKY